MSESSYMIWFLATALVVIVVLTVGTLTAAGLIHGRRPAGGAEPDTVETGHDERDEAAPQHADAA